MSTETRPLPAAERAYAATKELILSGRLPGGALLSEGEIAEQLELSRTPVREAFLRLEGEQLLRLIPKRGAVVVPVGVGEVADVLDVRMALETMAAKRLVQLGDDLDSTLDPARQFISSQRELAAAGDITGFAAADEQFHRALVTAANNSIAERFYATLADRQRRMTVGTVIPRPARLTILIAEHTHLLEQIAARDASGFETALRAHFDATFDLTHHASPQR
jgi:DNA-binding GntR family transcriptional regulator